MAVKRILRHTCGMTKEDAHFRLRLPAEMHEAIRLKAEANNRSINSEIVARLGQTLEEDDTLADHEKRITALEGMLIDLRVRAGTLDYAGNDD